MKAKKEADSRAPSARRAAGAAIAITVGGTPSAASREQIIKGAGGTPSTPQPGEKASVGSKRSPIVPSTSPKAAKSKGGAENGGHTSAGTAAKGKGAVSRSPREGVTNIPRPGKK